MKKGFTLVELAIVIVIVSILSIVGVREYQYQVEKSINSEAISMLRTITDANIHYYMEHGVWCNDINLLPITIEGKEVVYGGGVKRLQHKNFIYSATGVGIKEIAIAQRKPYCTRYAFSILIPKNLDSIDLYKITITTYDKITNMDKRIINEINTKGRL